ncbi:alpha-ketoacid dehydrogenase kinase N-terminal domain-containing protein [Stereum hirsutum FP-91666 SS1]|uniref:alpha-ketoacid dehydrogenase kinase N-terminal domain-containing protein n=1 Tax=Stereum hirsutum (strain FP-91666) TaxID=721885 RepID=UPI0004449F12|nr:alpha-ketoacid dehydrogenase kinase N-terminal domain-containing protein [Stereum hirsutum FP-91666 SS1]EIM81216.1 alpha-ketoacid dehydrogenase kinase N-terminal domain-containing protein [Stereum hirsutum FP-91666 SS1]
MYHGLHCSKTQRFNVLALHSTCKPIPGSRRSYTPAHFYQNKQLELYAARKAQRLSLRQLVFYGRSMNEERLIKSANYVRKELPVRIAHRIRDLQALPYVVVMQEGVARVYELYWTAFEKFRRFPQIDTLAENEAFCIFLRELLNEHASVIPNLSLGLALSSPYLPPDQLDAFMRRMLVSRISRRVLVEHHVALSKSFAGQGSDTDGEGHVGLIYTRLNVEKSVKKCADLLRGLPRVFDNEHGNVWPGVVVDGHLGTKFAYIKEHLEYIVFELLKNSMQATVAHHPGTSSPPSIRVTIVAGADEICIRISDQGGGLLTPQIKNPLDLFSFSSIRNATRIEQQRLGTLRKASAQPGGVNATISEQVNRWQQQRQPISTTVPDTSKNQSDPELEAGVAHHPKLGIGLPMCNIFARYFGGSLEPVSLDGWGTDVYLRLPRLGTNLEGIEV